MRTLIFDFQARALGLYVATLAMALDPQFVVILIGPDGTIALADEGKA
ncbi:hypothetical protein [Candidatus Chloroploca mongolica]|nr:hypothetical protein [Candidatus Chloroploca mongolica]